jgi:hypothetical protein
MRQCEDVLISMIKDAAGYEKVPYAYIDLLDKVYDAFRVWWLFDDVVGYGTVDTEQVDLVPGRIKPKRRRVKKHGKQG